MAVQAEGVNAKVPETETTPLISKPASDSETKASKWTLLPIYRVLLCGFLVSLSFGVTQVP